MGWGGPEDIYWIFYLCEMIREERPTERVVNYYQIDKTRSDSEHCSIGRVLKAL